MDAKPTSWKPVIDEKILRPRLEIISDNLLKSMPDNDYSLFTGNAGVALFFYYYWLLSGKNEYYNKGNDFLLSSIDYLSPRNGMYSLCSGKSGIMWVINYLIKNNFIEGDSGELFGEVETLITKMMFSDIKQGRYDYLHNALGAGFYFLNKEDSNSKKNIEFLIIELERNAEKDKNGLKWRSALLEDNYVYNTGLAHGIASVIIFLCKTLKSNILAEKSEKLLCGGINYILSLKSERPDEKYNAFFPNYKPVDEGILEYNSRLGWCYGDIGIGISLLYASEVLLKKDWFEIALNILLQTTLRKDPKKNSINDAGICHGSVGLAHIYNILYQRLGINEFKESALYWLNDALDKATFGDGLAGYKRFEASGIWEKDKGLLMGIAGIGLVFISAISEIEPTWDECLLLR